MALGAVLLLVAVFAVVRIHDVPLFGSDHDEYRMLAAELWRTGRPVVAGEGTKYPLGYSIVLGAADRLGLPMTTFAVGLNVALIAATAVLVWLLTRRGLLRHVHAGTAVAGLVTGAFVATSPPLWDASNFAMPDIALACVFAAALVVVADLPRRPALVGLVLVAALGVTLKTVALILGAALAVPLVLRPGLRRWVWAPPAVALLALVGQVVLTAPYPEHTTGYASTFWLRDPYDASAGTIGLLDLPVRIVERLPLVAEDAARAVVGPDLPAGVTVPVLVALLALGVAALAGQRVFLVVLVSAYALALAAWPYRSLRFGLPLLPIAAVGAGALPGLAVHRLRRHARLAAVVLAVVAVVGVGALALWRLDRVRLDAATEQQRYATIDAAVDELVAWADAEIDRDEAIASLDYRELTLRLDRPVAPVPYTSDPQVLWAHVGEADWFIATRGLYAAREARTRDLLDAHGERLRLEFESGPVEAYRVVGGDEDDRG